MRWLTALTRAMVSVRARRIGRREADELLSGGPHAYDRTGLVELLDLAAAPVHPGELAGRRAAVAAFVRAGHYEAPSMPTRSRRRLVPLLSRALAVKLAAGLGVLLVGGTALAAGSGSLPNAVQHGAHALLSPFGVPVPDATGRPGGGSRSGAGHPSTTAHGALPSADPALRGLCEAWDAGQRSGHPKDVDAGVLRVLAATAGGAEKIPALCGMVLGAPAPSASASDGPHHGPPTPTPTPSRSSKDKDHGKPTTTSRH